MRSEAAFSEIQGNSIKNHQPRLELCGALLLTRLACKVLAALTVPINETYYWSDSQVTLAWIAGEPVEWKTFVANRVAKIQRSSNKDCWHHVRSKDNPADIISRGINPEHLAKSETKNGPKIAYICTLEFGLKVDVK